MLMSSEPLQPKHIPPKTDIQEEIERLIRAAGTVFNDVKKKAEEQPEVELDLEKDYDEPSPYFPSPLSSKGWYATIHQYTSSDLRERQTLAKVAATVIQFEYPSYERSDIILTLMDDEEQHAYNFATRRHPNYFDIGIVSVGKAGQMVRKESFDRYAIRSVEHSSLVTNDSSGRTITVRLRKL